MEAEEYGLMLNVSVCYNSSDCTKTSSPEYCNFDKNVFGFCERCSGILRTCEAAGFLCYNGEKSCNDTCGCKKKFNTYSLYLCILIIKHGMDIQSK